ncbi:MAG: phenylalanine--tRNA ligase subunit beta [Oscillospiraceae bacterium]|jgi:phenylalanyl-tRNA synthetase beta chain|nr:phenylalanine--tRNA ligase subunit beta [Oscillospiraceae bacterium]
MKLSREWLNEFVDIDANDKEFAERMTLSGSKVEYIDDLRGKLKNIVVGRVASLTRHENSDRLWVAQTDVGGDEPLQIITAAQNLNVGDIVPVALHNSLLPDGSKITKGKIRGVKSDGMLCGLEELGLDEHDFPYAVTDGILIFSDEPGFDALGIKLGDDVKALLGYDDSVADFEITNNRPDCLSIRGLARESAITFGKLPRFAEPVVKATGGGKIEEWLTVEIADKALCARYVARVVKNIKVEPSPIWMRRRLRACGIRPINNIVDITNYVMLEYGQPMHAFDYACVEENKIIVRRARKDEEMRTLDGNLRRLSPDMLLITDPTKPIGLAGIMGGENSEITEHTKTIVLESATFDGVSVRKTALALGMRTDASGRFEKGLDIENALPAVQRACELIELLGAGEVIPGIADVIGDVKTSPAGQKLILDAAKINRFLGTHIPRDFMVKTLTELGFSVDSDSDSVTIPSWRADAEGWQDLAEEVARFYGYDKIEETPLSGMSGERGLTETQKFRNLIGETARALGYNETLTYSLTVEGALEIINPLGSDKARARDSLLPSMLNVIRLNRNHKTESGKFYEVARVYLPVTGQRLPDERAKLIMAAYGGNTDFFSFKADIDKLLSERMRVTEFAVTASSNSDYHPGRQAEISVDGNVIGIFGQVHPQTIEETYAAELDIATLFELRGSESAYTAVPKFPAVLRDLSLICNERVTIAEMLSAIHASGGKMLETAELFDVYSGEQVGAGKKSVAFSLTFRSRERSLSDEEVNPVIDVIIAELKTKTGAELRTING